MDIFGVTHGFSFNRVRFADGAVVDVRHHAKRPGPRCKTPAELAAWKAEEDRFVRALARRSYAAHCREAKELKAIVYGMGASPSGAGTWSRCSRPGRRRSTTSGGPRTR